MTRLMVAALLALLLTACGSDGKGGGTGDEVVDDVGTMPACSDVWVAGETLPDGYEGCETVDTIEAPAISECADGSRWTSYQDEFYAKYGGEIIAVKGEMSDDPAYSTFLDECA